MKNILEFLSRYEEFEILTYSEDMIFNKPIEVTRAHITLQEWHKCDVFIGFYSNRFPLEKAIQYVKKYQPKQINDLES